MIKLWAFDFSEVQGRDLPDYEDAALVQAAFDGNLARLASLEALGFEGVFFSEHHFLGLLCPSPNLLIAALARISRTLKLGVMGNVLGLHQPWRLVEELGMLDYLTDGRLEIGVSVGLPPEFALVGVPADQVRARYDQTLDYLDKALAQRAVDHHSRFWDFDGVPVHPRLRPEPRRRKWMTVFSPASAAVGAARGYKLCTAFQSTERVARLFDGYRDAAAQAGWTAGPDDLGLRRQVLICETDAEAAALHQEVLQVAQRRMADSAARLQARPTSRPGDGLGEDVRRSGVMDAGAPRHAGETASEKPDMMPEGLVSMDDEYIHGSPRTVADRIVDQCRRTGTGNFLAYHPNGLDQRELDVHYRLWGDVVRMLNDAVVAAPGR